jgi:S1-C subfamily serine protease
MKEARLRPVCVWVLLLLVLPGIVRAQQSSVAPRPPDLSLELGLITVRIETYSGDSLSSTATGFFCLNQEKSKLFLVTNRHVVRDEKISFKPDALVLRLHTTASDLRASDDYRLALYRDEKKQFPVWREVGPKVDVVTLELPIAEFTQKYVIKAFSPENFIGSDVVLSLGDPVVVIGYPRGFSDDLFNLPVARQGAVASVFPVPFRGNPFFLIDADLHPGTSGSPVITRPSAVTMTTGGTVVGADNSFYLVGINSGTFDDLQLNAVWFTDVVSQLLR